MTTELVMPNWAVAGATVFAHNNEYMQEVTILRVTKTTVVTEYNTYWLTKSGLRRKLRHWMETFESLCSMDDPAGQRKRTEFELKETARTIRLLSESFHWTSNTTVVDRLEAQLTRWKALRVELAAQQAEPESAAHS